MPFFVIPGLFWLKGASVVVAGAAVVGISALVGYAAGKK